MPTIEVSQLITAINSYFLNERDSTRSENLEQIAGWFLDNGLDRYYDKNKNKVSATYLAKILKEHKEEVFSRSNIQQCLDRWLKLEAEEIIDFFRSKEDTQELYKEFKRYEYKYYISDQFRNDKSFETLINRLMSGSDHEEWVLRDDILALYNNREFKEFEKKLSRGNILELNNKMRGALSYLGIELAEKSSLITEDDILKVIKEKRLEIIKEYLRDIGKKERNISKLRSNAITEEKIKELFSENVLDKYIQTSISKLHEVSNVDKDDIDQDPDFDENRAEQFDKDNKDEIYRSFLKEMKSIQSRYDNSVREDVRTIDKALWFIASTDKQKERVLQKIKWYRTNKLKINLEVQRENNKFKINVEEITRIGNGNENNHIIPVSVFLKSLKYSLNNEEFNDGWQILEKLCFYYGRNYEKNVGYQFVKERVENSIGKESSANLRLLIEDYIIPFVYYHWNERAEATYDMVKTHKSFGDEGTTVKSFNEDLEGLYDRPATSFRIFKGEINTVIKNYFQVVDIPSDKINNERFAVIVSDAIEMLRVWLSLFEQSGNKEFIVSYQDEYKEWKNECLNKQEFGIKLIDNNKLISKIKQDEWKEDWKRYLKEHAIKTIDSRFSYESSLDRIVSGLDPHLLSPGRTSSDSGADTDQDLGEFYSVDNIKRILTDSINDKLVDVDLVKYDDDIDKKQKEQYIAQLRQEQQTRLIGKLRQDISLVQSAQISEKFYIVGEKSNTNIIPVISIIRLSLQEDKELIIRYYL